MPLCKEEEQQQEQKTKLITSDKEGEGKKFKVSSKMYCFNGNTL